MLRKIVLAVAARSTGALVGVFLTLVVVRVLPLEQAGYFLLAFTVLTFLRPISVFGTDTLSLKHVGAAYELGQWSELFGHSLRTLGIVTIMTTVLSCAVWAASSVLAQSFWEKPEMTEVLRVCSFAILPMGLTFVLSSFFQAIQRTVTAVLILTVNVSAALAALMLVAPIGSAFDAAVTLVAIAWANTVVALGWWLWLMRKYTPTLPTFGHILLPSLAIWIATLLATTTKWNGQIIAAAWVSAEEIAYLAVAQRLSMTVSFIMIAINLVTAPKFAGLHQKNDIPAMKRLASTTTYLMIMVGVLVFAAIAVLSAPVMALFGEGFRDYGFLLVILATGQLINAVTGSSGYMLIMGGFERQYRNLIAVGTVASVLMSILLIPVFGITGAAVATALGISGQHLGAAVMVRRNLGINIYERTGKAGVPIERK